MTAGLAGGGHGGAVGARDGVAVEADAGAVFRAAIAAGVLSVEPTDPNWAGHYFYMFHDRDGAAWFKHRDTRAQITMTARRAA